MDYLTKKLEMQEAIIEYSHRYFLSNGFKPIQSPKIVPFIDDEEGHLIKVYIPGKEDEKLFLSRSPQLYKEIASLKTGNGKVYELGPVFRGEPFGGGRRANEFLGLDVEIRTNELSAVTDVLTDFVLNAKHDDNLVKTLKKYSDKINIPDVVVPITYVEATKLLACDEIGAVEEKRLSEKIKSKNVNSWILLTEFPSKSRGFYQLKGNELSDSFDLIADWEICSGGLRRRDIKEYIQLLHDIGWSVKEFEPYINIINDHLNQNTGGFGIGLERLVGTMIGTNIIEELQPYPRIPDNKILF